MNILEIDVRELIAGRYSENTLTSYKAGWESYSDYCKLNNLDVLSSSSLFKFRQHLVNETEFSRQTINVKIAAVKAVAKALYQLKTIDRNTYYDFKEIESLKSNALPERGRKDYRTRITPDKMREIVGKPNSKQRLPAPAMWRAMLLVLATSGMRSSEVCTIQVDDVIKTDKGYYIANIMGKSQSTPRSAPISTEAYNAIQDWLHVRPVQSQWLFNKHREIEGGKLLWCSEHVTRGSLVNAIKRYARGTGLERVRPHDFRRFVGTQLAQRNIRLAQKVLGHNSISTTAKHYVMDTMPTGATENLF